MKNATVLAVALLVALSVGLASAEIIYDDDGMGEKNQPVYTPDEISPVGEPLSASDNEYVPGVSYSDLNANPDIKFVDEDYEQSFDGILLFEEGADYDASDVIWVTILNEELQNRVTGTADSTILVVA